MFLPQPGKDVADLGAVDDGLVVGRDGERVLQLGEADERPVLVAFLHVVDPGGEVLAGGGVVEGVPGGEVHCCGMLVSASGFW